MMLLLFLLLFLLCIQFGLKCEFYRNEPVSEVPAAEVETAAAAVSNEESAEVEKKEEKDAEVEKTVETQ